MFPTGSVDQSGLPHGGPSPQASCHVEADHGHLLAEVISCTRVAVCLDSLPDRTSGRPPDLAGGFSDNRAGGSQFSRLAPSVWLLQFAGGDWMDQFEHGDELAYAISRPALWLTTEPMLMVSNPSRGDTRVAVKNVNSNVSGLKRAITQYRLLAAAASLAGH